jgi:anti-sigma B factor antagonist
MDLTLTHRDHGSAVVLAVAGEIDVYTSPALRDRIGALLRPDEQLIVDLSGVGFLDSTGLGVLVAGLNRSRELGAGMSLVCRNDRILTLFRITGLDQVFTTHATTEDALGAVAA